MYKPMPLDLHEKKFKNYWISNSYKLNRRVEVVGQLDYEYFLLLEYDRNVISYCERPLKSKVILNNKRVNIIPNFWIKQIDTTEKYIFILYKPDFSKEIAIQKWCEINKKDFLILNKTEIRKNEELIEI